MLVIDHNDHTTTPRETLYITKHTHTHTVKTLFIPRVNYRRVGDAIKASRERYNHNRPRRSRRSPRCPGVPRSSQLYLDLHQRSVNPRRALVVAVVSLCRPLRFIHRPTLLSRSQWSILCGLLWNKVVWLSLINNYSTKAEWIVGNSPRYRRSGAGLFPTIHRAWGESLF